MLSIAIWLLVMLTGAVLLALADGDWPWNGGA